VVPEFYLIQGIPQIKFVDALMPLLFYRIYLGRHQIAFKNFYLVLGSYAVYILFTILINDHRTELNEYFELYKVFKFGIIICFVSLLDVDFLLLKRRFFIPLFILVFIFNALHYYNLFNINEILEAYYNGGIHIQNFGKNSIGGEATKRLTGTIGNPNNNAILMLFFVVLLYPRNKTTKRLDFLWFFLAMFLFFLCQSRTGMIAFFVIMGFIFLLEIVNWRTLMSKLSKGIVIALLSVMAFSIAYMFSSDYESSVYPPLAVSEKSQDTTEMKPNIKHIYLNTLFTNNMLENNSIKGRFDVWKLLWEDIKEKPIFGHGPNKNYFYENELYAESGFFLMTYRYGFLGLLFYIFGLLYFFFQGLKYRTILAGTVLWQITVVIGITSLTNIPLGSREILAFFAVIVGVYLSAKYKMIYGKAQ
jgi:O-antigen ligase